MDLLRNEDSGVEPLSLFDVLWHEDQEIRHAFVLLSMAALGLIPWHKDDVGEDINRYLVIPEERGNLASFKLDRSPWLRQAMVTGRWQFVKYRHLSQLASATEIDRHNLKKIVGLRPIIEQDEAQIPLF
jgi:hypothetical protein